VRGFGNSAPYPTDFSQSFDDAHTILISTQLEMDGGDGSWIVNYPTQPRTELMFDEDQETNSERSHAHETCGFIAVETA